MYHFQKADKLFGKMWDECCKCRSGFNGTRVVLTTEFRAMHGIKTRMPLLNADELHSVGRCWLQKSKLCFVMKMWLSRQSNSGCSANICNSSSPNPPLMSINICRGIYRTNFMARTFIFQSRAVILAKPHRCDEWDPTNVILQMQIIKWWISGSLCFSTATPHLVRWFWTGPSLSRILYETSSSSP